MDRPTTTCTVKVPGLEIEDSTDGENILWFRAETPRVSMFVTDHVATLRFDRTGERVILTTGELADLKRMLLAWGGSVP